MFEVPPAAAGRAIALTVDDGFDHNTVAAYVRFAAHAGLPIRFNPTAPTQYTGLRTPAGWPR